MAYMFKLTIKSNEVACMAPPFNINPLTNMWHLMTTFPIHVCNFPKYVKLVELAMVVATLALGLQPKQELAKVRVESEAQ